MKTHQQLLMVSSYPMKCSLADEQKDIKALFLLFSFPPSALEVFILMFSLLEKNYSNWAWKAMPWFHVPLKTNFDTLISLYWRNTLLFTSNHRQMHAGFRQLQEKQILITNALLASLPSPKENVTLDYIIHFITTLLAIKNNKVSYLARNNIDFPYAISI